MAKFTYLASVLDGKISFPAGVLDDSMLSSEVNNTSTNETIPTSKAVYDSIKELTPHSITENDGKVIINSDSFVNALPNLSVTQGTNYYQKGYYYQHFDISGLGTNEEIVDGTKNIVVFWLSDSTEQIVEDIQNPTYIEGFDSGFQVGWWLTGVNDGRFPFDADCHFEITEIDANKITTKLYAKYSWNLGWVDNWLKNGKVDLAGNLSTDDYSVYCNGANTSNLSEKLLQTQIGLVTLSANSFIVGGANFFGSSKNITIGSKNFTSLGNTLTAGFNLINQTYSGTVVGHDNESINAIFQVGAGGSSNNRKTAFYINDVNINAKLPVINRADVTVKKPDDTNALVIYSDSGNIGIGGIAWINSLKNNESNKVLIADKNTGQVMNSNISANELSYLSGATSNLQSQINDIAADKGSYKNSITLSTGQTEAYLSFANNITTLIPSQDIQDISIKILAINASKTNIEKYSVKFITYKNDDNTIIATNPLCESVSSNGIQLIDLVDVKLNESKTGIQVLAKAKQEKVSFKYSISISQF